ncbi:hypothetical protein JW916_11895 [Candidatus Sumerlaeota bacterium]|nr:hypothetical protein [Candidatus Sumerlaeota bacterium]
MSARPKGATRASPWGCRISSYRAGASFCSFIGLLKRDAETPVEWANGEKSDYRNWRFKGNNEEIEKNDRPYFVQVEIHGDRLDRIQSFWSRCDTDAQGMGVIERDTTPTLSLAR